MSSKKLNMDKNIFLIVERLKKLKGFKTDGEAAASLKMSLGALSNHKTRRSIPYEALSTFCDEEGISIDWLLTGEGSRMRTEPLEVYGRISSTSEEGEFMYATNKGILEESQVGSFLGLSQDEVRQWYSANRIVAAKGKEPSQVAEECATYKGQEDPEIAEIVRLLKESPQDKGLVLKLLKGKKDIKEALEGFEISKIKEQEG